VFKRQTAPVQNLGSSIHAHRHTQAVLSRQALDSARRLEKFHGNSQFTPDPPFSHPDHATPSLAISGCARKNAAQNNKT
jgi:hypothetical protein